MAAKIFISPCCKDLDWGKVRLQDASHVASGAGCSMRGLGGRKLLQYDLAELNTSTLAFRFNLDKNLPLIGSESRKHHMVAPACQEFSLTMHCHSGQSLVEMIF